MPPKVTVFMPIYNGQKYLKEAIDSILNQTFTDFEFIIINDSSKDKSAEIIKSYNDKRIKFFENSINLGAMKTANLGFERAMGEYIVRMDQDDICLKDRIKKQVQFMDKNPEIAVCGSWVEFFGDMHFTAKYAPTHNTIITNMFTGCPLAHPSVIMRKSEFDKNNIRYSEITGEEYELWVRASKNLKYANIQKVLLKYRTSPNQMTKSTDSTANANKIVWQMQLENLEIDFSPSELELHVSLMSESHKIEDVNKFINDSNYWFDKIIQANDKAQIYDSKLLLKILNQKWYTAFKTIIGVQNNYNILKILMNNNEFKYLTTHHKFQLIFRYIRIKYKKSGA